MSVRAASIVFAGVPPDGLPIFQFAYVVDDLDAAADHWASTMGAGPFFVAAHHRADRFLYRGQPIEADVSYAFGYSGTTQIQLVVQHDELPSIYREMFPSSGGLHHIASLVADYDDARQRLLDQGHELACELDANDIHACYFDCRDSLQCFVELHSRPIASSPRSRGGNASTRSGTGKAQPCVITPAARSSERSLIARPFPEIDPCIAGVTIDLRQLVRRQRHVLERGDVVVELLHAARPDHERCHPWIAERPHEGQFSERLAAPSRDLIQSPHAVEALIGDRVGAQCPAGRDARVGRNAVEVAIREQPLRKW